MMHGSFRGDFQRMLRPLGLPAPTYARHNDVSFIDAITAPTTPVISL